MIDVASKLGPALQVGESLLWQSQQQQPKPQQQQQQQQQPPAKSPAVTQPSAPLREMTPSAPIPDPTPPPAYPSSSSAPHPAAIAGAAPPPYAPPSYEDSLAQAPEPPTNDPNRDATRQNKQRSQLPAL